MTNLKFDKENTALLVIDPYNDFISEGGKLWDRIKSVAEARSFPSPARHNAEAIARPCTLR